MSDSTETWDERDPRMSEEGYVGEFLGHDHESHWFFTPREG